jgi:voltage-gated potassium channel
LRNSSLFIILQKMRKPFLVIIVTYTISIIGFLFIGGKDSSGNFYQMTMFDAFYFVSYTATTIGFGEIPYAFTYPQRIWVTVSTFLTVLGWFYSIGTLVSLLQDKLFLQELERARFLKQIKNLNEKFIIILGYNQITRKIIIKAIEQGIRAVVIEKDSLKIEKLMLENFTPTVPVLFSESFTVRVLESAGLKKRNCKAIVSLFDDDAINLKITLIAKTLNKNVKVAVKSTTINQTENLKDLDAQIIVNPFSIISSEIKMALTAPNLFKLEKWLYKIDDLNANLPIFPKGLYVICGYGRMGAKIFEKLDKNNVEVKFIEINKERNKELSKDEKNYVIFGDADDRELLEDIGIKNAVVIIAATNDDTTNLSILATARKLNPNIITMARENDLADDFLFRSAKVNHIFTPSKILVNKITNALMNPLCDEFLKSIIKENNEWATKLVTRLVKEIGENPLVMEIEINFENTPEIYKHLSEKNVLNLKILSTSLHNNSQSNNIVPLLLQRENDIMLLPSWEIEIKIGDKILLACDEHAKNDIEYICQNTYEFYYALTGKEKRMIFKGIK